MLARNIAYALLLSSLLLLHLAAYSINGTPVFASVGSADKTQNNQKEKSHGGPLIRSVQPSVGSVLGGTDVIVKGKHFRQGAILTIGGIDAAGVLVNSKTIKGKVGPHPAGVVDVIVTNADGRSGKLSSAFTFRNIFSDVSLKAGVDVKLERGDFKIPLGGGVAVGDYNKDGLIDIYVTNSAGPNALLRNNGDMTFVNVASETGVDHPEGRSNGACFADYDNDGNLDLLVTGYGTTTLYHNTGHGTFTNANTLTGISDPDSSYRTMGCAWGDYDRDGFLDLIMVRHFDESDLSFMITHDFAPAVRPLSLYHNNGDGTFRDTTSLLGNNAVYPSNIKGASFQPVFFDYNNDGFPDIYVVNDFGAFVQPDVLWRNDGPLPSGGWKFSDVSASSGAKLVIYGMGAGVGDYNNDGFLDLYMTNIGDSELLRNNGDGTFTDKTDFAGVGIGHVGSEFADGWGTVFLDINNDGLLDLYVARGFLDMDPDHSATKQPNVLFINNGNETFTDVSSISGANDPGISRGVAYADFNNDGCLDLYVVNMGQTGKLFQNECDSQNSYLTIKPIGIISNKDGIGARVKVVVGGQTLIREVASGGSDGSQYMIPVHFGLGKASHADLVEIRWPSGITQTLTNVPVNQILTAVEPHNPIIVWNQFLTKLGLQAKTPPPYLARDYALTHVAMYDALLDNSKPKASPAAVVAGAGAEVLTYLFPNNATQINDFEKKQLSRIDGFSGSEIVKSNIAGHLVGKKVVKYGKTDGSDKVWDGSVPKLPGMWTGTLPVAPTFGLQKTYLLKSGTEFQPSPPYPYGSPADLAQVRAVLDAAHNRTPEQIAIVHKWADLPPPTIWNNILNDRISGHNLSIYDAARASAYLNAGIYDSFVSCWNTKFNYWTARPFQRIDDPTFTTVIRTPNFPSYTSGHSTVSAAAATILGKLFPDEATYFIEQANEAAISRLWGGIHFPQDNNNGLMVGLKIGQRYVGDMTLEPHPFVLKKKLGN